MFSIFLNQLHPQLIFSVLALGECKNLLATFSFCEWKVVINDDYSLLAINYELDSVASSAIDFLSYKVISDSFSMLANV